MKKMLVVALVLVGGLSACNTVKGVGEDVEAAGRGIGTAAEEVKEDINDDD